VFVVRVELLRAAHDAVVDRVPPEAFHEH
jgi:hypothetical protein